MFVTVFLDLVGFGLVIPYLPAEARELGASSFVATLLGASYSLGQFVFVPLWGALSDRVGRRPILIVSVATNALAMAVLGTATQLWLLFACRIVSGVATANIAVAQAYIADVTPPERRPQGMALIGVAIGTGFVLGPAIGGTLAALGQGARPGELPAFVAAGLSFVNLLFVIFGLPESLPSDRRDQRSGRSWQARIAATRDAFALGPVLRAVLVNLLVTLSFAGLEQTFRMYNQDRFGMSTAQTGYALLLAGLVLIGVQGILLRQVAGRFSPRALVLFGLSLEAVGFALVAAAPPDVTLLLVGLATLCFGSSLVAPTLPAFVSRWGDAHNQGRLLGVLSSSGALARVLGPALAGVAYQAWSPRAPYALAALGMALACGLAVRLTPPKRADSPI